MKLTVITRPSVADEAPPSATSNIMNGKYVLIVRTIATQSTWLDSQTQGFRFLVETNFAITYICREHPSEASTLASFLFDSIYVPE